MGQLTVCSLVLPVRNGLITLPRAKTGPSKGLRNGLGGKQEEGESILDCAVRESREEAGSGGFSFRREALANWVW